MSSWGLGVGRAGEQAGRADVTLPSNVEVADKLDALKVKDELPPEKISETGKEVREQRPG